MARSRSRSRNGAITLLIIVSTGSAQPVNAAVRTCLPEVTSELHENASEIDGKRQALDDWRQRALQNGVGFTRWELAWNRRVFCTPTTTGRFQCLATGLPCTINQVPPKRFVPLQRGKET